METKKDNISITELGEKVKKANWFLTEDDNIIVVNKAQLTDSIEISPFKEYDRYVYVIQHDDGEIINCFSSEANARELLKAFHSPNEYKIQKLPISRTVDFEDYSYENLNKTVIEHSNFTKIF